MSKIFISYRRQDTELIVGRIHDKLATRFGADAVFMDIDKIPPGVDFHDWLDQEVGQASIVLALIGTGWINARDEAGRRRLDNPNDFVRIEIESALRRGIPVIPVRIGAPMPRAEQLPESLWPLTRRNASVVDAVHDFHPHMDRLIRWLEWHLNGQPSSTASPQPAPPVQPDNSRERDEAQAIKPGSGESFKDASFAPEMVVVPAGEFLMGSPQNEAERRNNEGPQHKVIISKPFAIGVCAVTFDEWDLAQDDKDWRRITGIAPRKPSDEGWGRGDRPVINVSHEGAEAYVKWLSEKTGKDYRLPTEVQWEYSCRAGTTTCYWWGDGISKDVANYEKNNGKTLPVKSFDPNPWGLYQVHGNVWEWCADGLRPYSVDTVTDPIGSLEGAHRTLRGGSWRSFARGVRAACRLAVARDERWAYRGWFEPQSQISDIGFRCARVRK